MLIRQVDSIRYDIERFLKQTTLGRNQNSLYFKFYEYIADNPKGKYKFELLFTHAKPYQLLKHCQIELNKASLDDNCLNSQFTPYINKSIQLALNKQNPKKVWWVNRGSYLNFMNWKKKHPHALA